MEDVQDQCLGERQERFIQKSLKDFIFQDQQPPPKPSDLFFRQNWGTGGRTSKCPLSGFVMDIPTAHPVEELCR